jgi:hypothetical protein
MIAFFFSSANKAERNKNETKQFYDEPDNTDNTAAYEIKKNDCLNNDSDSN